MYYKETSSIITDFSIVIYDKRGHGLSDIGEVPYSMDDHVSDLEALLDHLRVTDAIICGLSVGGLIAQGLYARRPDLVQALILCDTAHKIGSDEMWNSRIAAVEKGGMALLVDAILERWFTAAFRRTNNLEFAGYRFIHEATGESGIKKAEEIHPDLVLLDIDLPDIDGYEVCRQIRTQSDTPILMLTARKEDIDKIVGIHPFN